MVPGQPLSLAAGNAGFAPEESLEPGGPLGRPRHTRGDDTGIGLAEESEHGHISIIGAARQRYGGEKKASFLRADACAPSEWADGSFDAAACVMAVHDVPDAAALMRNIAAALKPGGRAVIVMMHPCFRIPKESHWGWDADQKVQYRRLDRYGKALEIGIQTRPGLGTDEGTVFYHRPLADLISAMGKANLGVTKCIELFSHRRSQVGPFSKAEHRAAQ